MLRLETEGQVLRGRFRDSTTEEWCNRRVLARIHRLTIGQLRREIEPVTSAAYARFLYRWQHVAPNSRLHGIDGTLQAIRQLEGYEIPAAAWETQILPRRIAGYKPEYLDRLCYSGDVMWGRLSPHPALTPNDGERKRRVRPTKLAPVSLFARASAEELVVRDDDYAYDGLSQVSRDVLAAIDDRRRSLLLRNRARRQTHSRRSRGSVVATRRRRPRHRRRLRRAPLAHRRKTAPRRKGLRARPRSSSGRWTRLQPATQRIDPDLFARRLLTRGASCIRDVIARESLAPRWRDLLMALRRMEARGEIRGGRFIATVVGEQFALPDAIDALRAARRDAIDEPLIAVSSYDPLQAVNALLPEADRLQQVPAVSK